MKRPLIWLIPMMVLAGLLVWRFATRSATQASLQLTQTARRGMASNVEVAPATVRTIVDTLEAVGNVESPFRVQISPKTAGRIEFLNVREGDPVKPGQILVTIDKTEVMAQVLQQQANIAEARSRLAQAQLNRAPTVVGVSSQIQQQQANLESARAELNQTQKNYGSLNAAAKAQIADAEAKVRAAQAQTNNAQAVVKRERANLQNAQIKLNRTLNLYKQGFTAAQDVDDAKTAVAVAQGALDVANGGLAAAQQAVTSAQAQKSATEYQANFTAQKGQADIAASRAKVLQAVAALSLANANRSQTPAFNQNIAALQATVRAAEAQLKQAQSRLSDTVLKSPINGTVTARKADVGNLASPGQAILEVQFLDWLFVTAALPIEQSKSVREGLSAQVSFDALPNRGFTGAIKNVNFAADPLTRQFTIRIRLENKDHEVRPGMYARVKIETRRVKDAVVVPREAVKNTPDGPTVTLIEADGTARIRKVTTGVADAGGVQILQGIKPADKVVVLSYGPIREGQKVSINSPRPQQGNQSDATRRRRQQ